MSLRSSPRDRARQRAAGIARWPSKGADGQAAGALRRQYALTLIALSGAPGMQKTPVGSTELNKTTSARSRVQAHHADMPHA